MDEVSGLKPSLVDFSNKVIGHSEVCLPLGELDQAGLFGESSLSWAGDF